MAGISFTFNCPVCGHSVDTREYYQCHFLNARTELDTMICPRCAAMVRPAVVVQARRER